MGGRAKYINFELNFTQITRPPAKLIASFNYPHPNLSYLPTLSLQVHNGPV
jgi:hypothetical protein